MVRGTCESKVLFFKVLKIVTEVDDVLQAGPKLFEVNELNWEKNTYSVPDGDPATLGLKSDFFNGKTFLGFHLLLGYILTLLIINL